MTPAVDGTTVLVTALLIVTLGYIATCAVWPFKPCRRCGGIGKLRGPLRGIRYCPRCRGTGLRIRLGRHVWNGLRRIHRDHQRANRR